MKSSNRKVLNLKYVTDLHLQNASNRMSLGAMVAEKKVHKCGPFCVFKKCHCKPANIGSDFVVVTSFGCQKFIFGPNGTNNGLK